MKQHTLLIIFVLVLGAFLLILGGPIGVMGAFLLGAGVSMVGNREDA